MQVQILLLAWADVTPISATHESSMPRPEQDVIQPIPAYLLHHVPMPTRQIALRLLAAGLILTYTYFVPGALNFGTWQVFLTGTILLVAVQSLLGMWLGMRGYAQPAVLSLLLLDLFGVGALWLNDPARTWPSLGLYPLLIILQTLLLQGRWRYVFYALSSAVLLGCAAVRALALGLHPDFSEISSLGIACYSLLPLLILARHQQQLRERSARITGEDALTGLGNRWTFYESARYLLPYHQRNLTPMIVMYAEIEVLAQQRSQHSRAVLDIVAKKFATLLEQRLRASDVATRYDRLSFALLLADTSSAEAEKIAFEVQQEFNLWAKQTSYPAFAHFGIAPVPPRPVALDQILLNINAALSRAQQSRKGVSGAVFADPEHR